MLYLHGKGILIMEEKSKNKRGGKREGAGRPGSNSKLYAFRAPGVLTEYIEEHDNKTDFFNDCIVSKMKQESEKLQKLGKFYQPAMVKDLRLPFFDISIVAGFPIPLDNDEKAQDIELLRMLCPNPEASYLIRVEGNSMIDAGINSGDIVIVDKSNRNPSEREVAVCEHNGEYTLKRFIKRDGVGWLVPANPDYPEILVSPDDQFSIWGTVTFIIHRPRF